MELHIGQAFATIIQPSSSVQVAKSLVSHAKTRPAAG
jgi:hypothetical protein